MVSEMDMWKVREQRERDREEARRGRKQDIEADMPQIKALKKRDREEARNAVS